MYDASPVSVCPNGEVPCPLQWNFMNRRIFVIFGLLSKTKISIRSHCVMFTVFSGRNHLDIAFDGMCGY